MANETEFNGIEWAKCAAHPEYFISAFGWIKNPQQSGFSELRFYLWRSQSQIVKDFLHHRLLIVLKARQLGISWLCCAYALWLCLFHNGRRVLLFSRGEREAIDLLDRIKYMISKLPEWMQTQMSLTKSTTTEIQMQNGSAIESLPATQNVGRSFTASLVVMDEVAFMQQSTQLYTSLKPTIDGGGQLILVSTANGARGLFYTIWQKAMKGLNGFKPIFLPWSSHPERNELWYARVASESISSSLMMQEYPATADEAFSATDTEKFLPAMLWWDSNKITIPALDSHTPVVVAADAGIYNDHFALVGVSRYWQDETAVAVRYIREWKPRRDAPVNFDEVEQEIRHLCATFNIVELAYDPYQLHEMMTRLRRDGVVLSKEFNQASDRLEADKQLLDLILQRRLFHDGNENLRLSIDNADKKVDAESRRLRLVKREETMKIDLAVACSMACYRCLRLPL